MPLVLDPHAPTDFDFIIGDWQVDHRRLNARFSNCTEWTTFDGRSSTTKTLGGFGNLEDNILHFPTGTVRALAMRSFCATSGTWSIWWLDGRQPTTLDVPVTGKFSDHIGVFSTNDVLDGVPRSISAENKRSQLTKANLGDQLDGGIRSSHARIVTRLKQILGIDGMRVSVSRQFGHTKNLGRKAVRLA
ncbi:hypothetical protein [Deinococcus sp. QL22]|uniref:hypothetical protein n=1 Tax=Deinococcus sp. QL22 TaxID=2939437 RepID=UPI002016B311|nr:hypothetical protein [Deinococcus sp. QL22]